MFGAEKSANRFGLYYTSALDLVPFQSKSKEEKWRTIFLAHALVNSRLYQKHTGQLDFNDKFMDRDYCMMTDESCKNFKRIT